MAEFRWILLGLGLLLCAGIYVWGARRSTQAPGNAELRETTAKEPPRQEVAAHEVGPSMEAHEWEMSPFEPLSIKTSDFEHVPMLDEPILVHAGIRGQPAGIADDADTLPNAATGPVMPPVLTKVVPPTAKLASAAGVEMPPAPTAETSDRIATSASRKPNSSEKQRIVTLRVCAPAETLWSGSALLAAFEAHGLAHGRYQVFHRRHVDGSSVFSVASLVEPGTFDVAEMATQQFKGITLFAVLPGPLDPLFTVDEMLAAARGLAGELPGTVQDAKGVALSAQRMAALREDIAQFQATLPVS